MDAVEEVSSPEPKTPRKWQQFWTREKNDAETRLKDFRKTGNKIVSRYRAEGMDGVTYNLFHQNISTQESMLYGNTPKAHVQREHQDPDDDIARVASYLLQRMIEAECKDSEVLRGSLQDRLLPGLGVARVRYEVDTGPSGVYDMEGNEIEQVLDERAPVEYVHWQDFLWGWARCWNEVPWIGFRSYMEEEDVEARFGKEVAEQLEYSTLNPTGDKQDHDPDHESPGQKAEIWEFWHKRERKVFWYSHGADNILDQKDDPLKLERFWPMPKPLIANLTTTELLPKADFSINQDLYNEIDQLQDRIAKITEAVKVVGVYDQSAGDSVGRMLKEGFENALIPVDNWAMFAEKGGLKGCIDFYPVQDVVNVLQTLNKVQQEKISQLYEITGVSDLMRGGNTDQYTSDGTNRLKAKFGSIRIQRLQDQFAQYASDLLALKAEIVSKHFLPKTIYYQANAEFIPKADKDKLQPALQLLKSPMAKWRIEVKPESIAMVDYAQLKNDRIEYLNAMATFIQSSQAMMKQAPESLPLLLEFTKFGLAGFKGADYLEGTLDRAIEMATKSPPKQQQDNSGQEAIMLEQVRSQNKMRENEQKFGQDMQREQAKAGYAMQHENQDHQNNMSFEQLQFMNNMKELMAEHRSDIQKEMNALRADMERERAQSQWAMAEDDNAHDNTMVEKRYDRANNSAKPR